MRFETCGSHMNYTLTTALYPFTVLDWPTPEFGSQFLTLFSFVIRIASQTFRVVLNLNIIPRIPILISFWQDSVWDTDLTVLWVSTLRKLVSIQLHAYGIICTHRCMPRACSLAKQSKLESRIADRSALMSSWRHLIWKHSISSCKVNRTNRKIHSDSSWTTIQYSIARC